MRRKEARERVLAADSPVRGSARDSLLPTDSLVNLLITPYHIALCVHSL